MMKLLKIEWLKMKSYNAFIILSSFFALGVLAINYFVYSINKNVISESAAGVLMPSFSPYDFSNTWQTTSYVTGWLLLLSGLLIVILITNEFTFRTHRQNIIDGWTRKEFIHIKIFLALLFAVAATVMVIITALLFGFSSGTSFSMNGFSYVGYFFLKAFSYNMVAVLMGVLIRKTGFAIALFFIYTGVENIVSHLLDVWSVKLRTNNHIDLGSMGDYLPMNASDGLLAFPDNPLKGFTKGLLPTDYTWVVVVLAVTYLLLFFGWSYNRITKTDL